MKLAFALPHSVELPAITADWEFGVTGPQQAAMVKHADELGYDMVAVPEHFVVPHSHLGLSGPHYLHSTVAQAFIAGAAPRIRVNSCVTILPLQHPVVLAKALATADWMSGGRITATFGVGWDAEEFAVIGVPFHERGRMADEYLAAMIELWTAESPRFEGKYVSFDAVAFAPKPVQRPHLPVWIAGDADAVLKRIARFASGWWPFLLKVEDIPAKLDFIKSQPTYDGRPFDVMYPLGMGRVGEGHVSTDDSNYRPGMSKQEIIDELCRFAELGVTFTSVPAPQLTGAEAYMDYAQWVIEEIKPHISAASDGDD
ncbi:TIGR03619 family F420-dependent LLM class oxidoreductase [Mycobacterium sp.]|uniref:TIGR03619 family F420-dependent LLM class oxidoreductase n=1 Tax=Mycobacterium sp. TaxID=1785 RepID=UPI003C7771D9